MGKGLRDEIRNMPRMRKGREARRRGLAVRGAKVSIVQKPVD